VERAVTFTVQGSDNLKTEYIIIKANSKGESAQINSELLPPQSYGKNVTTLELRVRKQKLEI
jgi:hypothetical protein